MESQLDLIEQSFDFRYSLWVREALDGLPDSFTITDPCISGHPIVFASIEFLKMSGYSRHEVIGRNGSMFQGVKTNRRSVMEIREAIREERSIQVNILNYRKDGMPFWMLFHLSPVFSKEDGKVIHFVGVQVPILRKLKWSGTDLAGNNGVRISEDGSGLHENMFGCCRREVYSDSVAELDRVLALDSVLSDDKVDEPCKAGDIEKRKAVTAMNNIFSVLTHYSELTGRLVCGKRCCVPVTSPLGASLNISLGRIKQSFVLTDPHLSDMPIVYASDAFVQLTGYSRNEVLGRNCRFLSGQDTDSSTQFQIKERIRIEQPCTVCILNYRKDKSSFWNYLHISPVRNASGKIAYFVGVQIDASGKNQDEKCPGPHMRHLGAVGAVKVAVRVSSMGASTSK
uniref:Putative LOV domain-containing protein n=1 Tax=Angelica archangelica TaxID=40949 RepID=A0A126X220_ANGAR|nr:putative LOV domain-containing protein [Angelica archangelica]